MPKRILALAALAGALTLGQPAQADEQELVDDSTRVLAQFLNDDDVDIVTYVRASGAFVGATIEGGHVDYEDDESRDYYRGGANPRAILIDNSVSNPGAERLRALLAGK